MANKIIYYANLSESYSYHLIREINLQDKNYVYSTCPVVNHKKNRTFIGLSPIDFEIEIDNKNKLIKSSNPELFFYDNDHLDSPTNVVQLLFPRLLFWTNEKNIWFEFNDHPLTSYKNNFVAIGGWFNLSNWTRNMSLAIQFVDNKRKVVIMKGDPLFRITFHSQNLNDGIILKEEKNKEKLKEKYEEMMNSDRKDKSLLKKLFSNPRIKKCPFRFLYK